MTRTTLVRIKPDGVVEVESRDESEAPPCGEALEVEQRGCATPDTLQRWQVMEALVRKMVRQWRLGDRPVSEELVDKLARLFPEDE